MRLPRHVPRLVLVGALALSAAGGSPAQPAGPSRKAPPPDGVDVFLRSVSAGRTPTGDASEHIPGLIAFVESGDTEDAELAMRALAALGSKARPAVAAVCTRLDDRKVID